MLFSFIVTIRINQKFFDYNTHQELLNKTTTISGIIKEISHNTLTKKQTTLLVQLNNIKNHKQNILSNKYIYVFCPTSNTQEIQEDQKITLYNITLRQPPAYSNYQLYLLKENVWATTHCKQNAIYIETSNTVSFKQSIKNIISSSLETLSSNLFAPLFFGKKEKSIEGITIQHQSVYWGIAHHMARSGAHLAILFSLVMLLLHYTQMWYVTRYVICMLLLLGYASISQSSISFIRALIMILLHIICKVSLQMPSSLHILTLTTLVTIIYNPMQIFFLDFQLSFGITYIIIWLFTLKQSQTIAFQKGYLARS
tara:strand:+ start:3035 stop:3970 length:936 start_codon:yes stop_codon:yes gene_type:complete